MMDTSGFCQIGRYGTLSLLKYHSGSVDDDIVTSFGIDDEELTFGSSTTCGVRLYYPDVDGLHCKIVFDRYKAFLAILGASGAVVDGCKVFPHTSGESSGSTQQTIIPLSTNSVFEIHGKRFKFTYPPKELRKALYATPARPPQRCLRLSMIHSAQVFSPRPSNDPRQNLKMLQSPMKNPSRSPLKPNNSSPLKSSMIPDIDLEEPIVLVHTNHPQVVEEEKDLVILENIPVELLSPSKADGSAPQQFPILQIQNPPQTPARRKSLGGTALHRAVLIRSAHRAVIKAEKDKEDEDEEMEVLDTVVDDNEGELNQGRDDESTDVEMPDIETDGDSDDEEGETDKSPKKSIWKRSLEKIMPWSSSSSGAETESQELDESTEDFDIAEVPEHVEQPLAIPKQTLGPFMTPQLRGSRNNFPQISDPSVGPSVGPGRFSLGGGEAQRVLIQQPWKVCDLVLPPAAPSVESQPPMTVDPPPSAASSGTRRSRSTSPTKPPGSISGTPSRVRPLAPVSEEERKAIQERRRSAVKELSDNSFWVGGAPGSVKSLMTPTDLSGSHSPRKRESSSPTKGRTLVASIKEDNSEDEDLDTHGLLEKIKETVSDMRRRRSVVLSSNQDMSSPRRASIVAPITPTTSKLKENDLVKIDFTKMGTPKRLSLRTSTPPPPPPPPREGSVEVAQGDPFTLLRPGALEAMNQSLETHDSAALSHPEGVSETDIFMSPPAQRLSSVVGPREEVKQGPDFEAKPEVDNEIDMKPAANAILTRRQRSRTPQVTEEQEAAGTSAPTRRGRKLESVTESEQEPPRDVEKPPIQTGGKFDEAVEKDESTTPAVAKRGRPTRSKAAPSADDGPKTKARAKPPSKPSSKARKTKSVEEEVVDEDPLDSCDAEEGAAESTPVAAVAKAKPKTPSTRKRATTTTTTTRVKQEEEEATQEELVAPPVPTTTTTTTTTTRVKRNTRANTASQQVATTPAARATTATATGKAKGVGRPKTPATAPAAIIMDVSADTEKENAPKQRQTSATTTTTTEKALEADVEGGGGGGAQAAAAAPVKLRVSRSSRAANARKKVEKVEEEDDQHQQQQQQHLVPGRQPRPTRVMRTRTKTG